MARSSDCSWEQARECLRQQSWEECGGYRRLLLFMRWRPCALAGALAEVLIVLGMATFCSPGHKFGYDVPDWLVPVDCFAVVACPAAAAMWTISHQKVQFKGWSFVLGLMAWTVIGADYGAIACVWIGFGGYFVVQSNAGPIRWATIGAIIGAFIALLWRWGITQIYRRRYPLSHLP